MSERTTPVRPRHAASLVIYRRDRGRHEVVMGRRSDKARFRPGVYVFPGGMLEPADFKARPATPLDPDIPAKIAVGNSPDRANALAMAAIRESMEECGLVAGIPGDVGPNPDPTWQAMRGMGLAPALDRLAYLGRAITPAAQPIRFHARFFAIDAAHTTGELGGSGELSDLRWVELEAAKELEVMNVTLLILESLQKYLAGRKHQTLFLSTRRGKRLVTWE